METQTEIPWWFWGIGVFLLLWGFIGIWFYWMEMTMPDDIYLKEYGEEMMAIRHRVPKWSISGYAIGVWAGLLGSICLLLRRRWAVPLYIASFICAILGWGWYIIDDAGRATLDNGGWVMFSVVLVLCIFSIWFARNMRVKGYLR